MIRAGARESTGNPVRNRWYLVFRFKRCMIREAVKVIARKRDEDLITHMQAYSAGSTEYV